MPGSFVNYFPIFQVPIFQVQLNNFPIFQVCFNNVPIFQVEVYRYPIFQVKYPILSSLKKGTSGQPLFGFPIFQDFDFQFFKLDLCVKPIFAQGPIKGPLQVLDRTLPEGHRRPTVA